MLWMDDVAEKRAVVAVVVVLWYWEGSQGGYVNRGSCRGIIFVELFPLVSNFFGNPWHQFEGGGMS